MAVTDGYLRQGADLLAALGRPDGLLFLAGPDTGTPGTITASGTLTIAVTLTGRESVTDAGTLAVATTLTGDVATAVIGMVERAALISTMSAGQSVRGMSDGRPGVGPELSGDDDSTSSSGSDGASGLSDAGTRSVTLVGG